MCKNGTLATMRMKVGIGASSRVIGVWLYFTHLINRVDYSAGNVAIVDGV